MRVRYLFATLFATVASYAACCSLANAQLPTVYPSHPFGVVDLIVNERAGLIFSAGWADNRILVWGLETGRSMGAITFPVPAAWPANAIGQLAVSGDGTTIAASSGESLFVASVTSRVPRRVQATVGLTEWVGLSYTGDTLVCTDEHGLTRWIDVRTDMELHQKQINASVNGQFVRRPIAALGTEAFRLVYANFDTLFEYNASTGNVRQLYRTHSREIRGVSLDPGGNRLAVIADSLHLFEAQTGAMIGSLDGGDRIRFSTTGEHLVREFENSLELLSLPGLDRVGAIQQQRLSAFAYSESDQNWICASAQGTSTGGFPFHGGIFSIVGSDTIRISASRSLPLAAYFDADAGITVVESYATIDKVTSSGGFDWGEEPPWQFERNRFVQLSANRKVLAVLHVASEEWSGLDYVSLYDNSKLSPVTTFRTYPASMASPVFSLNADASRFIWGDSVLPVVGHAPAYTSMRGRLDFAPDDNFAIRRSRDTLFVLKADTKELSAVRILPIPATRIDEVIPDVGGEYMAAITTDHEVWISRWPALEENVALLKGHTAAVADILYTADGRYAVTCSADSTIRFWNIATGAEVAQYRYDVAVRDIDLSIDEKTLLSCAGGDIALWDVPTLASVTAKRSNKERLGAMCRDGLLEIELSSSSAHSASIAIYNLLGSKLEQHVWQLHQGANARRITLSTLPRGTYLITVTTSEGILTATFKR